MSYLRLMWIPAGLAAALLLSGALAQQSTQPAKPAPGAKTPPASAPAPFVPPKADPEAVKSLNHALDRYGPKREGWLQTTVWQKADVQGLVFEANGQYLAGPSHRLRIDLTVKVGGTQGKMEIVSNGASYWESLQVGEGEKQVNRIQIKELMPTLTAPGSLPQVKDEFFQAQAFTGVAPLLQNLQQQFVFTKQESGTWKGQKVLVLTGTWTAEIAKAIVPSPDRWPSPLPRKCLLYLAAANYWPLRLEWWGPAPPQADDALLLQMEFRDAKLPPPPPDDKVFAFDEGQAKVTDVTEAIKKSLQERNKKLAAAKGPGAAPTK